MNPSHRSTLRRIGAGAAAVLVAGGLFLAQSAQAETTSESARLGHLRQLHPRPLRHRSRGRCDTFPDGASNVILATGQDFADALASSGMAGAIDAPILLTLSDRLLDVTKQALEDLGATDVYLMGGTAALSQAVEDAVYRRLATRFTASRATTGSRLGSRRRPRSSPTRGQPIIGGGIGSTDDRVTAFLTSGLTFPDAVSASPVAYAGNLPILLTATDVVPQATIDAIKNLGIEHVAIVGGTAVISDTVKNKNRGRRTGVTTQRLAGVKRWDTNIDVVNFGADQFDMGGNTAYLSTGMAFPDALVFGPAAGQNLSRLLLIHPDKVPPVTGEYVQANAAAIDRVVAIGGEVWSRRRSGARWSPWPRSQHQPDLQRRSHHHRGAPAQLQSAHQRGARKLHRLRPRVRHQLRRRVLDPSVVGSQGGSVTVSDYTLAAAPIAIETVNGQPVSSGGPAGSGTETQQVTATANADGQITFTADSTDTGSAIPFVYLDEDANGELGRSATGVPDEQFGVGGKTDWVPAGRPPETTSGVPRPPRPTV